MESINSELYSGQYCFAVMFEFFVTGREFSIDLVKWTLHRAIIYANEVGQVEKT